MRSQCRKMAETRGSLPASTNTPIKQEIETEIKKEILDDEEDHEGQEAWKLRLTHILRQMMFVSGETAEVPPETTSMIEEIVRQQVIEMVR